MSEAKKVETSTLTEEQIVKFNQEFLTYNKSVMYGTDVISVLNKAIDNNERYAEDDDSNFIDIAFKLKDDIYAVKVNYTWNKKTKKYESKLDKVNTKNNDKYNYNFNKNNKYYYSLSNSEDLKNIKNFLDTSKEATAVKDPKNPGPEESYTITYTGFSDFKRMIFKCVKVERNDIGKVSAMYFEQIKSSTYNNTDQEK